MAAAEVEASRRGTRRIDPYVAEWFEAGEIPNIRGLTRELGSLGLLGTHLQGYGCAGMSATDYGLACLELEASDSGVRSLVSVQGSLVGVRIPPGRSLRARSVLRRTLNALEMSGAFGIFRGTRERALPRNAHLSPIVRVPEPDRASPYRQDGWDLDH